MCNYTYTYQFSLHKLKNPSGLSIPAVSGLIKKTLLHEDHVLICDIDYNGDVRGLQSYSIDFTKTETIISDISSGLLFLNIQRKIPLQIDVYTSNIQLVKFFKSVISKMWEDSISGADNENRIIASTEGETTRLYSENVLISVGPEILEEVLTGDKMNGLIMDIEEVEKSKIELEATFDLYDWCIVIVPRSKYEGYAAALQSFFVAKAKPFHIDTLSDASLMTMFDFIFEHSLSYFEIS